MTNLLKVSAAALFLTVGLTSCESKPAAETSTTETTTTTPATESTTATTDSASTMAPADGAMATDTTKKM